MQFNVCYHILQEERAMYTITPTVESDITKIVCPYCKEKVPRIGLQKESKIQGLTFKCRKCGKLWEVKTE